MGEAISAKLFVTDYLDIFEEAFEKHHGIFLDKDNSLFDTLSTVTAAEASIPVGGKCATPAAQVSHVTFYLEVLERYVLTGDTSKVDWGEIWRTVREVSPERWDAIRDKLKATYRRLAETFRNWESWDDERSVGGAIAVVAHSAYHLGEIRQALCTLR
jgi:hypothetical protein